MADDLEKLVNEGIIDQSEIGPKKPITDEECVDCLENICRMFVAGCKNCEGQALEYQQRYISVLRHIIGKIQSDKEAKNG